MIKLDDALKILEDQPLPTLRTESVSLEDAFLRVLATDVLADSDIPAFNKSAMDGYACRREDLGLSLDVLELIPAGRVPKHRIGKGQCAQIMTGGMVPDGADCVVMQEYIEEVAEQRIIFTGSKTENNILYQGEDLKSGAVMLEEGTLLTAQNLALLATAGQSEVDVYQKMKVAIISTGSELVETGEPLKGAQIRNSNRHQLAAQIKASGHQAEYFGIVADDDSIGETIQKASATCDVMLLTGGASVGKFDLVPQTLLDLGFDMKFNKVAIQPGKPVSFSVMDEKFCFGLSGNPVSSFLQFELLAKPFLQRLSGMDKPTSRLELQFDGSFTRRKAERRYFLPVVLNDQGRVTNPEYHGSAHLHALDGIFGFAEIPEGKYELKKGEQVHVRPL